MENVFLILTGSHLLWPYQWWTCEAGMWRQSVRLLSSSSNCWFRIFSPWLLFEQYGTSRYNRLLAVHNHQGQCLWVSLFRSLLQTFLNSPPYLNFACEAKLLFTRTLTIEPQVKKILTSRLKKWNKKKKKMKEITNFFFFVRKNKDQKIKWKWRMKEWSKGGN